MGLNNPTPPSPSAGLDAAQNVAKGQQTYNTQAGEMSQAGSMVNQNNVYGGVNYAQTGVGPNGVPIYSANTTLSPTQQNLYNLLTGTQATAGQQAGNLLSGANYGSTDPATAIGNSTSGITGNLMSGWYQSQQPFMTTAVQQLDTQLRNQGLAPGQQGYDNAMRALQTNQMNAVSGAASAFTPQAFQMASGLYTLPMTMAESLGSFGSPTTPNSSFVNAPGLNIAPADLTGATATENKMLMDQYNAQLQQQQNMMSGLFGIPTALLGGWASSPSGGSALTTMGKAVLGGWSDRRLKKEIKRLGTTTNGLPYYSFRYIWGGPPKIGLMADEVEKVNKGAVTEIDGFKQVNYALALSQG